jgi:cobyrinic acid a,c-diamide synthase
MSKKGMLKTNPRIIIAALKGGAGKTILSLGLTAAWRRKGKRVITFKKGPDFIDAGWLAFASGEPCHNLDSFMMSDSQILRSFLKNSAGADLSLIEGNRGLFDGLDREGRCSTAELGKTIDAPVVIIADVTMCTRTVAALILGCQTLDPDLRIAGVILNRVAGTRQQALVTDAVEHYCGLPVLGSVPKLKEEYFPERHMGLVPHQERDQAVKAIEWARTVVEENLDLDRLWELAHSSGAVETAGLSLSTDAPEAVSAKRPRIGFIRDSSFWFYYPENLEKFKELGAELVEVNAVEESAMPDIDALYIGGGFPETRAELLAKNRSFRESLKAMIEAGLPVYAECGGLIYLGESLLTDGNEYAMVGALPIKFVMEKKPQGHGYTVIEVDSENPYFSEGEVIKGHEFHYSRPIIDYSDDMKTVFSVKRGHGLDGKRDGLCRKNLFATYTHIHSAGYSRWGEALFQKACRFMELNKRKIPKQR